MNFLHLLLANIPLTTVNQVSIERQFLSISVNGTSTIQLTKIDRN